MVDARAVAILAAIAQYEGYYKAGTLARRNNNPGNLRGTMGFPGGVVEGYAHFLDAIGGWSAACALFDEYRTKGDTLEQFIYHWAPPSDNNDTEAYISLVETLSGIKRTEKI